MVRLVIFKIVAFLLRSRNILSIKESSKVFSMTEYKNGPDFDKLFFIVLAKERLKVGIFYLADLVLC